MVTFEVEEEIIMYAFRYALGRKTYAVENVADFLTENWNKKISEILKNLIKDEIIQALDSDMAGSSMDRRVWTRILELE